jgi:hypothetical protein
MENSKHYSGNAIDIRSRNTPSYMLKTIQQDVRDSLPNYQYIIENDHCHFEYDLKQTKTKKK